MEAEEVLSLDLEDNDLLYRIRRNDRFVYVSIKTPELIPHSDRSESSRVLKHLRSLPVWQGDWQTLTVTGAQEAPQFAIDSFQPHRVPPSDLIQCEKRYNLKELKLEQRISNRLFKVRLGDQNFVIKIARFKHEIQYLRQELQSYRNLRLRGFTSMPLFYGYVYEEHDDRVIGFAMEYLHGRPAELIDLEDCRQLLKTVHTLGFILGDLNRYNWIKTERGMKVFDFETACAQEESRTSPNEELTALEEMLRDESGIGHR
jgi:hypothetical protein